MHRSLLILALALGACKSDTDTEPVDSGDPAAGLLLVEPCDLVANDFGTVEIGSISTRTLRASNLGEEPIQITSVTLDLPFAHTAATPIDLPADSTNQFTVRFQPTSFGTFSSDLTVNWSVGGIERNPVVCTFSGVVTGDADGDGFDAASAGGTDCDDNDPTTYPGAPDAWYDGSDSNCDQAPDYDQDGDGHVAALFSDDPETGGDCQDADPDIHPGATDRWYDGVDTDCDGANDYDQDGDGYTAIPTGGTDCDDLDAALYPGSDELLDLVDNDCNGQIDDAISGDANDGTVEGDQVDAHAGASLEMGDLDGNGRDELIVGAWMRDANRGGGMTQGLARGAIAIWPDGGYIDGESIGNSSLLTGFSEQSMAGDAITIPGDVDGDGADDLLVGSPGEDGWAGAVYLIDGPTAIAGGGIDPTTAMLVLHGNPLSGLGAGLGGPLDLDGDGNIDITAIGRDVGDTTNWVVVEYGGTTGEVEWADLDVVLWRSCGASLGGTCGEQGDLGGGSLSIGNQRPFGADFDGDGYQDLMFGDPLDDGNGSQSGRVWVVWGRNLRYDGLDGLSGVATTLATGIINDERMGEITGTLGDQDGDGDAEVYVQVGSNGDLLRFDGDPSLRNGNFTATDADLQIDLGSAQAQAFQSIGDWNGDGIPDIGLGFPEAGQGAAAILSGEMSYGLVDKESVQLLTLTPGAANGSLGSALPQLGHDITGDGVNDFLVGDDDEDGKVFVFNHP